jgi:DNA-binding NarL/FixJ family response regulator
MATKAYEPIGILIVDDHPIVRHGYTLLIESQPDLQICGTAASEVEALQQAAVTNPAVAIVDICLTDSNGVELIKKLKSRQPRLKILVISAQDEDLYAERVLEAGALGYINKQEATDRLINGIRTVLSGEIYVSEHMTRRLLHYRVSGDPGRHEPTAIAALTDRELHVYQMIGNGRTTKQIAAQLHLSPKTVERYRENIKQKLRIDNATQLVQHATRWVLEKG